MSELWSSFSLPAANRPVKGYPTLHLVEQLCLALNDEFRTYLPVILPCCIQVLSDAERCSDYTYVHGILHTLEVFVVAIINRNLSFPETADGFHDIKHGTGDEILKKTEQFKFFDRASIIRNTDSSNSCALFIGYVIDSCIIFGELQWIFSSRDLLVIGQWFDVVDLLGFGMS
ncbi:hypothetical protein POM88_024911 [Heracleum sosnowskyi]|uniref:Uncharacterized protein n=1 Tax=Heracleum sosnowskyi TaxID=360622 RepID=A0AAD8MMH2_9APIA|nr:hypothetical protein POM88_024911 [Heracleum sosnowskyi]